jgi:hypothetical protein
MSKHEEADVDLDLTNIFLAELSRVWMLFVYLSNICLLLMSKL